MLESNIALTKKRRFDFPLFVSLNMISCKIMILFSEIAKDKRNIVARILHMHRLFQIN